MRYDDDLINASYIPEGFCDCEYAEDGSGPNPTVSDEDVNVGDKWADLTVEIQGAWTALGMSQAIYDGEEEGGLDLGAWKPYSDLP